MHGNGYLAFDIGASGGRAIMGTLGNERISLEEIHRFHNGMTLVHGRYHWDIYRIFEDIKEGLKKAAARNHIFLSIGIDTWGVDYGLLDGAGHILDLPYAYRDHRTDTAMDEFFRILPKEQIYHLTGIQFLQFNTLFQLYAAVKERSPVLSIAKDLLFIPDLLNYLLTGIKKSEFTIATTSQLYNPVKKAWAQELFGKIGIPPRIMQDIVNPGTILGKLTIDIAEETGMPQIAVAAVASHDTGSAIAAVPAEDDHFAYISSGTWSLMGIESEIPIISQVSIDFNVTNEGGVERTFRVLKNIMGLWLLQECKKEWSSASFPDLVTMAAAVKPFNSLVDPDHPSLLNPKSMPEALSCLAARANEPAMSTPGEFCRCIFESLAFRYRQTLDELKKVSNKHIRKIHIIGGGSQNGLLCQFTANATGVPVIAGPVEATAVGNIMVQAMAQGEIKSLTQIRQIIRNSFELKQYIPEDGALWNEHYSRFLILCNTR